MTQTVQPFNPTDVTKFQLEFNMEEIVHNIAEAADEQLTRFKLPTTPHHKVDWLVMENDLRNALTLECEDKSLQPHIRLAVIDQIICSHTGRGTQYIWPAKD